MSFKKLITLSSITISFIHSYAHTSWKLHDKVEVKWGGQYYKAEVMDVTNGQYKIHYDGYGNNWDEWVKPDRIKGGEATTSATTSSGKFKVGQQVEAYNIKWYKATVLDFGTGNLAGYVKVHYNNFSSASDQYLKESSIRAIQNNAATNDAAGLRNGRYIILSYGDITHPITLGYFDLNNGRYTYYDAAKKPLGNGSYSYSVNTKKVQWQNGALKKYGADAGFEIDGEGITHKVRLNRVTIGSNSLD